MFIADSPVLWKILFDSGILNVGDTEVIFGSKFISDSESTIYLYRTLERVRSAMIRGKTVILLKLDQLYDSLYDVLNQRYLTVDNQKFCRICIGGESINCAISREFRCIVVSSRDEAHHDAKDTNSHLPVAFLNRFEKQYLDSWVLEEIGVGTLWKEKHRELKKQIRTLFIDHYAAIMQKKAVFVGYDAIYTKQV